MSTNTVIVDHSNTHKKWTIDQDLYILKNWLKEPKEIEGHLKRNNPAIKSRKHYLRHTISRIQEIKRTFPLAEFTDPTTQKRVYTPRVVEQKIYKKSYKRFKQGTNYQNFEVSQEILDKYEKFANDGKRGYSLKSLLFFAKNLDKSNSNLALQLKRSAGDILVQRTKVRRALENPNSFLFKAYHEMSDTMPSIVTKEPRIVKLKPNTATIGNRVVVSFSSFEIDQENKQIIFKLD